MTSPMIRIFILLILAGGTSFSQNSAGEGLGSILDSEGSIKSGLNGSFNASGYDMQLDPETGKPFFRPVANPNSTTSTITWGTIAPGYGVSGAPPNNGTSVSIRAIAVDGTNIYVGGGFPVVAGMRVNGIAKWNGTSWSNVGAGVNGSVYTLKMDGSNLYAGGQFTSAGGVNASNIAKWNGTSWSALGDGLNQQVLSLEIYNGELHAGGWFTQSGLNTAHKIAKWDGDSWTTVGPQIGGAPMNIWIHALKTVGSDLYMGGIFVSIDGVTMRNIARWNGSSWSALGDGFNNTVFSLAHNNGILYAGGSFTKNSSATVTLNYIAAWDGLNWSPLQNTVNGTVNALYHDGTHLYAGGSFFSAGPANTPGIARWDGSSWSALGTGVSDGVLALAKTDGKLLIGSVSGYSFVEWNGTSYSTTDHRFDAVSDNVLVRAICIIGSSVFIGGKFTRINGIEANSIAKWDGSAWTPLGTGTPGEVRTLETDGINLYAGGTFSSIGGNSITGVAKWNGTAWSDLGGGVNGTVYDLGYADGKLYAGGTFSIAGGISASRIAVYNGTGWAALGSGVDNVVSAIEINGSDIYVAGYFINAGGSPASRLAKWNGSTWSALGAGVDNAVFDLQFSGTTLYAAGQFLNAGGNPANRIAKWDGSSWSPLGSGVGNIIYKIAVLNNFVYAVGLFSTAGGNSARYIAKWDGTAWLSIGNLDWAAYTIVPSWEQQGFLIGGSFLAFDYDQTTIAGRLAKFTDSDNPLPVELVSFSGALRNNAIQLNWQTATEVDNHGFEIEKRTTKSDWQKIGFVEGHGTSNSPKYYSFTDKSVLSGEKYQYRLKQIDGDGTFTYSNIIEIEASAITGFTLEQNYPNPFSAGSLSGNTETVIRFALPVAGDVRLDVYNSAGERIKTLVEGFREAGVYSVRYSAEGLASGIYFYNLEAGGSRLTGKMLLLR